MGQAHAITAELEALRDECRASAARADALLDAIAYLRTRIELTLTTEALSRCDAMMPAALAPATS
jgi:hypothetical protein